MLCAVESRIAYLGEKRSPDRLDIDNVGSLDEGGDLVGLFPELAVSMLFPHCAQSESASSLVSRACVEFRWLSYGDLEAIVGEDERRVRRCQLSGRHLELCDVWKRRALTGNEVVRCGCR